MRDKLTYYSKVLGIKNYILPPLTYHFRSFKGQPKSPVLVVVSNITWEQKRLLKKIMSSIKISAYSILEFKDKSETQSLKDFLNDYCEGKKIFIFSERLSQIQQIKPWVFRAKDLNFFLDTHSKSKENKYELWKRLKSIS